MNLRRKILMGVGALCLMAALSPQARADFDTGSDGINVKGGDISITFKNLSDAGFAKIAGVDPLTSSFSYGNKGTTNPVGNLVSDVLFAAAGANAGLYAYLYQIQVDPKTNTDVGVFQVNTWPAAFPDATVKPAPASPYAAYEITGMGGLLYPTGFVDPTSVKGALRFFTSVFGTDYTQLGGNLNFKDSGVTSHLTKGQNSTILVVFSRVRPGIVPSVEHDGGNGTDTGSAPPASPADVYAPAPEPSAAALCGIGIFGLFGAAAYRRLRFRRLLA